MQSCLLEAFGSWDICQQLVVSSCFILFQTGYYLKVTYKRKKNLKKFDRRYKRVLTTLL